MEFTITSVDGKHLCLADDDIDPKLIRGVFLVRGNSYDYPYVMCPGQKLLHRIIINAPEGMLCDHINHNTLDNRRKNLRLVTHAQNTWNCRKNIANTSGFRGVTLCKKSGKFTAGISHEGKRINLGGFRTPVEAALAYDQKAKELRGSWAALNFPLLDLDNY